MKRRNIIISFLLAACLIVGVGYAAIADQLTVSGSAEYAPTATALDQNVYFTGIKHIVKNDHTPAAETDAFIVNVVGGTQTATITAQFTENNITQFHSDSAYVSGVVLEVAIENTSTEQAMTVSIGSLAQSGEFGTQSPFELKCSVKTTADNSGDDIGANEEITVAKNSTKYIYIHVKISVPDTIVSAQQTIAAENFEIVLPVTMVG